jgi:hypothetical protein
VDHMKIEFLLNRKITLSCPFSITCSCVAKDIYNLNRHSTKIDISFNILKSKNIMSFVSRFFVRFSYFIQGIIMIKTSIHIGYVFIM